MLPSPRRKDGVVPDSRRAAICESGWRGFPRPAPSDCNADVTATGRRRTASTPAPYGGGNGPAGWHLPPAKLAPPRIGGTMTRLSLTNRYALALAGLLAIAIPVGAQPGKTKAAEPPANRDPYFTPTAANSTSTMPRVIIRT